MVIETSGVPIFDATGTLLGYHGIDRDITDRKQSVEALRKSEESLSRAQRVAKLGNWDWDLLTNNAYWSSEMYRLMDVDPDTWEVSFPNFLETVHPEDQALMQESTGKVAKTGEPVTFEWRSNPNRGPMRHFESQVNTIRDSAGKIFKLVGTVQDITARKEADAASHFVSPLLRSRQCIRPRRS